MRGLVIERLFGFFFCFVVAVVVSSSGWYRLEEGEREYRDWHSRWQIYRGAFIY